MVRSSDKEIKKMKDPLTGRKLIRLIEKRELNVNSVIIEIDFHFLKEPISGDCYTDEQCDEINLKQINEKLKGGL